MCRQVCVLTFLVFVLSVALAGVAAAADTGLVGWWKFDDGSGTVAKDSSGNRYDGTVYDAAWVAGNLGGALDFSGAEYVDVPPESWSTIVTQATVCFWAYGDPDFQPQANFIFGAFSDPANNEARRMCAHVPWSDGNVYFDTGGPSYNRISRAGDAADYEGTWTHWTFLKNADTGDQQIYINGVLWHSGTGMTNTMEGVTKFTIGTKPSLAEGWYQGMIDDFRLYDRALDVSELPDIMLGKGPGMGLAASPSPAAEATDVPRDTALAWEAGEFAATHDVYFGTVFDDVNDASRADSMGLLVSQGQAGTTYASPAVLEYGQTYYWRVDEVNAAPDNTIFKGETWSFTVEPLAYPAEGVIATSNATSQPGADPENMVNGSGLNENDEHSVASGDMWLAVPADGEPITVQYEFGSVVKLHQMLVWNYNVQFELMLGFGLKDVTVEYSENGTDWMTLAEVELAQGTARADYAANTTVDFGGVAAKYVRLTVNSGYGFMGQFGLSEVRFLSIPVNAREAQPADGATDVGIDAVLGWRSGREAVSHEVYLGTDPNDLALVDTVADTSYAPGDLDLATTYYWSITEVNEATSPSAWAGSVWGFTTQGYVVVEDFESYTDDIDAGEAIFQTWIDGWENDTGSTVGHLNAPFAETTMVHGGGQSMPLFYDNTSTATSETERTLDVPMDWTASGIKALSVPFAGAADNDPAQLYLKVNGTKVVYGGAPTDLKVSGWLAWTIDMSSLGGNLSNITSLVIGIEGAGAAGVVYVDDIRLYPQETEMVEPVEPDPAGLAAHYTFDSDFQDSSGNGNHAEAVGGAVIANDPTRGSVARLDGLGDGIRVPAIGGGTASEVTISVWMTTDVAWTGGYFSLFHCDGWTAGDIHMHISDPGRFSAGVNGLMGDVNLQSTTLPEVDEWYNVTVTVSAAEGNLYVNGVREDSLVSATAPESFSLGEGHLGIWLNGTTFERALTGQIDEVRFYDRVLSYGEVAGLAGRTTPLYKPF